MANTKEDRAENIPSDFLSPFLDGLGQLPRLMVDGMLNQAETEDEKQVIRTLGVAIGNQFTELIGYIRERSDTLSAQQREESQRVLRVASANSMIGSGSGLAANLGSQVAKIGLSGIIREIKKIVQMLLDAFGIKIPKWLNALFLVIDELVDLFLSTGSPALAGILSKMEQDHLAERALSVRLQREYELRAELDHEENA